jgi:hypothetical protein
VTDDRALGRILKDIAQDANIRTHDGPSDYFWPSSLGRCERRVILERAGVRGNPLDDDTALFFWIGNVIHDAVQKGIAKRLPGKVWTEVSIRDEEYKISGRVDNLRLVEEDGEWVVYEYKTVRTDAFRWNLLKPDHILQVGIYLTFLIDCPVCMGYESMKPRCITCQNTGRLTVLASRGKLAYIGKEDGRVEVFEIVADEALRTAVKEKLKHLEQLYIGYVASSGAILPPKLSKEPILDKKGIPEIYKKSSTKFGHKKGDPKLKEDWRVRNCPYLGSGRCCGDREKS